MRGWSLDGDHVESSYQGPEWLNPLVERITPKDLRTDMLCLRHCEYLSLVPRTSNIHSSLSWLPRRRRFATNQYRADE